MTTLGNVWDVTAWATNVWATYVWANTTAAAAPANATAGVWAQPHMYNRQLVRPLDPDNTMTVAPGIDKEVS